LQGSTVPQIWRNPELPDAERASDPIAGFMSNSASCLSPIWLTAIGVRDSDFQSEASKLTAPNLPLDTVKRK